MAKAVSKRKAASKAKPAARRPTKQAAAKPAVRSMKAAVPRRAKAAAPKRKAVAKPRAAARKPPQRFTVSHLEESDFKTEGLRPYAQYRDLGIALASGGLCQAHVIRLIPPVTDEVRKRHYHDTELQLIYVLKGWMRNEFEGHGEQLMRQGSCWLQPPGIRHTVLDYSDDCEVLEIIVPADFETVELA